MIHFTFSFHDVPYFRINQKTQQWNNVGCKLISSWKVRLSYYYSTAAWSWICQQERKVISEPKCTTFWWNMIKTNIFFFRIIHTDEACPIRPGTFIQTHTQESIFMHEINFTSSWKKSEVCKLYDTVYFSNMFICIILQIYWRLHHAFMFVKASCK